MQQVQLSTATKIFRELDALLLAKQRQPDSSELRILSFGCSIGDELATLKTIFPKATVLGCDINPEAIAIAQRTTGNLAEIFLSSEEGITARGPFDIICAFSSLCINPLPPLDKFLQQLPYSYFLELTELLTNNLKPGGVLALKNTSYPFSTTPAATHYHRIRSPKICQNGFIPTINPTTKTIALKSIIPAPAPNTVFERSDISGLEDWDFIDCVFQKKNANEEIPQVLNGERYKRPDGELILLSEWSRSNFDGQKIPDASTLLNLTTHYQTFSSNSNPGQIFIERTTFRDSLSSTTPLTFKSGSWLHPELW